MKELGYYDGNFGPLSEMQIPMCDRASWFGDGVYDAGPARHGVIFALDEHVDRFFSERVTARHHDAAHKRRAESALTAPAPGNG